MTIHCAQAIWPTLGSARAAAGPSMATVMVIVVNKIRVRFASIPSSSSPRTLILLQMTRQANAALLDAHVQSSGLAGGSCTTLIEGAPDQIEEKMRGGVVKGQSLGRFALRQPDVA